MPSLFPTSYDSLVDPIAGPRNAPGYEEITIIANINDAIEKVQTKVGVNGETNPTSLEGKIALINKLTTKGDILCRTASGYERLPSGTNGFMLVSDNTQATGLAWLAPSAGGTVTNVSGVNANGITVSIATGTTTPVITIGTNVTAGLVKSNGTGFLSATPGSDFYAPGSTDVSVSDGGTGGGSYTANGVITAGTTTTGPFQVINPGVAGQVLTSNGSGSPASMQPIPSEWTLTHSGTLTNINDVTIYNTGTLTAFDQYRVYLDILGTANYDMAMRFNGDSATNYTSTNLYNSSVATSGSLTGLYIVAVTASTGYRGAGEININATGSPVRLARGNISSSGGIRFLDGYYNQNTNITSIQLFRLFGSGNANGIIRIYGKNN